MPRPVRPRSVAVKIATVLGRANRRDPKTRAQWIQAVLRAPQRRQPPAVQAAHAAVLAGQVALIRALNTQIEEMGRGGAAHFGQHRDADIYLSQPARP